MDMHDSYVISDVVRGGYSVSRYGKYWRHFNDYDAALAAIKADMVAQQFWPDVYFMNERGTIDLLDDKGSFVVGWTY